jgi:ABC-type Mn2+/Zn2+ transport system ATPase subunit
VIVLNKRNIQIDIRNVVLGYDGKPVLPVMNLTVNQGDFLGVVGPNGAGKSTFLKAILGLLKPMSGEIVLGDKIRFGYVPQREALDELFPLTVRDIVSMARYPLIGLLGRSRTEDKKAVDNALEKLEISNLANHQFRDISGGQKQRTLIARALATDPDVLILDEPTNGMDLRSESTIMEIISKLNDSGQTVIMVTHLLNLIVRYAKTTLILNDRIHHGNVCEILNDRILNHIYDIDVEVVADSSGRQVVLV